MELVLGRHELLLNVTLISSSVPRPLPTFLLMLHEILVCIRVLRHLIPHWLIVIISAGDIVRGNLFIINQWHLKLLQVTLFTTLLFLGKIFGVLLARYSLIMCDHSAIS